MRAFTQTHYCADATCKGFTGFEVRWSPDVWDPTWGGQPAEPQTDTCPHCQAGMLDEPVSYEDAIDGLMDELLQGRAIGDYDLATLDRRAVLAAVQAELQRQARARNTTVKCRTCNDFGEVLIGSHSVGGGCWNDQWDICPACNGETALANKEKVA